MLGKKKNTFKISFKKHNQPSQVSVSFPIFSTLRQFDKNCTAHVNFWTSSFCTIVCTYLQQRSTKKVQTKKYQDFTVHTHTQIEIERENPMGVVVALVVVALVVVEDETQEAEKMETDQTFLTHKGHHQSAQKNSLS